MEHHSNTASSRMIPDGPRTLEVPAVSVIIPVFNAERHIGETLESISAQTLLDLEVIVVDDGSTDRSMAVVTDHISRDPRFHLITGPATGSAGTARNKGLAVARGEYLAFLDADDLFAPSMLEKLYRKAKQDDADIVMTGFRSFNDATGRLEPLGRRGRLHVNLLPESTPFAPQDIAEHIFSAPHTTVWNKIFRADFITELGLHFQDSRRSNDAYFNLVALAEARRLSYVDEFLVRYRASNKDSLQGSQADTDWAWVDATRAATEELRAKGLYEPFRMAMTQRVAIRALDRLRKCTTLESFHETYDRIQDELFPEYGLDAQTAEKLPNKELGARVIGFLNTPRLEWAFTNVVRGAPLAVPAPTATLTTPESAGSPESSVSWQYDEGAEDLDAPDVSVVLAVRNAAPWLHEALQSVLSQTGVSLEIIAVDNGSSDDSLNILRDYTLDEPRLKLLVQRRGGLSQARNVGADAASGRYLIFLDGSDYWMSDFLSSAVARADREELEALLFAADSLPDVSLDERHMGPPSSLDPSQPSEIRSGTALAAAFGHHRHLWQHVGTFLIRASHLRQSELRFNPGIIHQDGAFAFSLLLRTERAAYVPLRSYARRALSESATPAASELDLAKSTFLTYVEMVRELGGRQLPPASFSALDSMVTHAYSTALTQFAKLPGDQHQQLRELDPSPEAQASYHALREAKALEASIVRF
ncbi:glycosyltransferase family 2 protein [Nesterenkonia ebinurensis]|uniref:glycosyltransferase family 2 protein n=1 Tax=Nesterenkonia ebinurensis TaxID=2608252 RepID=UPI00123CB48C|nr:glycosyltransferase family 2 protein [Nesterenkonia ebinurensis]